MLKLGDSYFRLLEVKPFRTKVATALVVFTIGDVIAQFYEQNVDKAIMIRYNELKWDYMRTLHIASFGAGVTSWLHIWWGFLDKIVEKHVVSAVNHHYTNALSNVAIDQLIGSPVFNIFFFSSQSLLQVCSITMIQF